MGRILTVRSSAAVLRPCGSAPVVRVGWEVVDQNRPGCTHVTEAGSSALDRDNGIPLTLEYAANVSSPVIAAACAGDT